MNGIIDFKFFLISSIFLFSFFNCQSQDFIEGKIVKIINANSFLIEKISDKETFSAQINDTKPISTKDNKYKKAIDHLAKNVLSKTIYFSIENDKGNILGISIIYNCIKNDNKVLNNGLPCLSATSLDIEVIKKGFVVYTGNNEYLNKIAQVPQRVNK